MPGDNAYKSAQEFLSKMDSGRFDWNLREEAKKLSPEVYKSETQEVVRRFLRRQFSFPACIAALDAALARLLPKLAPEELVILRPVILANNERVMKEMERRERPENFP